MAQQALHFTNDIRTTLEQQLATYNYDKLFVVTDSNTLSLAYPLLQDSPALSNAIQVTIPADDVNKNVSSLAHVWQALSQQGASRRSMLINLGGGMVTDLGGFAAATFKRGIQYINIPTTLLGAVDAAVGGKTGINFNGLKNEIGAFAPAEMVLISTQFFATLTKENFLSGYAEMLKHALLSSGEAFDQLLTLEIETIDPLVVLDMLEKSVKIKRDIVESDPYERGIRKALNLGHTIGHAFESLSHQRDKAPISHGYAVAWGLVCELILSHRQQAFPLQQVRQLATFVLQHYGTYAIDCDDYDTLVELMQHDKKNEGAAINFTLLSHVGGVEINQTATPEDIKIALDLYRDLFHL